MKGDDGEDEMEEGETKKAISSFKSSSSPCVQVSQLCRQQQHQPTTTNSNKCMPISIKSPISWLPETCCNDSSGSGGSSNSRNTNTLVMPEPTTNGSRLFYCPEKYIDLGNTTTTKNPDEAEESKRTCRKQQPKQQRQHNQTNQQSELEGNCDFSVVFFEGRAGGGTSRSYKQNQSRTPLSSTALLQRTSRSANATPVASSKPFPLETAATVQLQKHPYFQPSHDLHHHQYSSYNDHCEHDEVDPIEKATKDDDGGAAHRQIRSNQIMGKTYLSDGASLTSLDGLCEIRASTPVEIKKASRVIVNYPPPHHQVSDSKTVSRCLCKVDRCPSPSETKHNRKQCGMSPLAFNSCVQDDHHPTGSGGNSNNNNIYEKLIDDSYGILICEGENAPGQNSVNKKNCNNGSKSKSIESKNDPRHYHHQIIRLSEAAEYRQRACGGSQKLKILCAKCLENHDPLLTNCVDPLNRDDDHHPTILDQYNNPTSINGLATMQNWQESNHIQHQSLPQLVSHSPYPYPPAADSDTTDYPSDTEFTTNNNPMEDDGQSLSTHFSSATYAWSYQNQPQHSNNHHHHQQNPQQQHAPKPTQLSQFIWAASSMIPSSSGVEGCENGTGSSQHSPKEFTGLEYVRTWLMASHPRTFATYNISNDSRNINSSTDIACNNIRQHPLDHQQEQENGIKRNYKNSNGSLRRYATHHHHLQNRNDKGLTLLSSATTSKNNLIPFKNKSACDKTISKKKRYRQLEKRQRPVGRGASPPAKELCTSNNIGNVDVLNGIIATATTTVTATTSSVPANTTTTTTTGDDNSSVVNTRFQPPPSRKQHPLLFYDMIPRQEQQKPLTATSHKKCRDQLDLFHKELETVV